MERLYTHRYHFESLCILERVVAASPSEFLVKIARLFNACLLSRCQASCALAFDVKGPSQGPNGSSACIL